MPGRKIRYEEKTTISVRTEIRSDMNRMQAIPSHPTDETFEAWNEQMSRKYNPDHYHKSRNPLLRLIEGRRTRAIIRSLSIKPDDRVLDIGCGAGNMLSLIRAHRTGVDLSDTMLIRAKANLSESVTLRKMSADRLDFPDHSFDKIICSEVIEHVLHPRTVLQEISRVLTPDGLAAVSIPNEALIEKTKSILQHSGLSILMKNKGHTNLDDVENEWHLHRGSRPLFEEWNGGILRILRVIPVPFVWAPFRYVFLLRKTK